MSLYTDLDVYQCPGETYTISRAIHLGRLAHYYPKCKACPRTESVDELPADAAEAPTPGRRRLTSKHLFREDDIRGVYANELDRHLARRIGMAVAEYLAGLPEHRLRRDPLSLVVGRDIRTSSPELAEAATEGVRTAGHGVVDVGLVTTPAVYFAVNHLKADGGIMVTGSHDAPHVNGFKLCRRAGAALSYQNGIAEVEKISRQSDAAPAFQRGDFRAADITEAYLDHLMGFVQKVRPLRVVVDAGNGIVGKFVPLVMERLPVRLVPMFMEPDGQFPNHAPDPFDPANRRVLAQRVREANADLGIGFDGDGDRLVVLDETGEAVRPDMLMLLLARHLLERDPGGVVVYDLRCSWMVRETVEKLGGAPIRERAASGLMKATMRRRNAILAGGLDGRYAFRDNFSCESGLVAMIHVLNLLSAAEAPLSELVKPLRRYHHTGQLSYVVDDQEHRINQLAEAFANGRVDYLDGLTVCYRDWWFNVRKDGDGTTLHLNIEAKTRRAFHKAKQFVIKFLDLELAAKAKLL